MMVVAHQPGVTLIETVTLTGCPAKDQSAELMAGTICGAQPSMIL